MIIKAQGLTKKFGNTTAVDNLDMEVFDGEIFGLIGPDGGGKTTTMRLLCGLLDATSGTARVCGLDAAEIAAGVAGCIGYMPQKFSLYGDLTVGENLEFFADMYQVPDVARSKRVEELYVFSGLGRFKDRLAEHLSGGMQKKLALSCNLIHTPRLLLLDEPTTGVDPVSRRELWGLLHRLREEGTGIFVSTPYMDEAQKCDRVGFLSAGHLIACDTPEKIKGGFKSFEEAFMEMGSGLDF
jgi:ABC-2 type transport system ATP-binding protein